MWCRRGPQEVAPTEPFLRSFQGGRVVVPINWFGGPIKTGGEGKNLGWMGGHVSDAYL